MVKFDPYIKDKSFILFMQKYLNTKHKLKYNPNTVYSQRPIYHKISKRSNLNQQICENCRGQEPDIP